MKTTGYNDGICNGILSLLVNVKDKDSFEKISCVHIHLHADLSVEILSRGL